MSADLRIKWGLRKKILASMIALILLLGLAVVSATRTLLLKVLKTEFQYAGLSSARSIAANSLVDVLTQNTGRLKKLIDNEKNLDPNIAYIFIVDQSGHILTHTFAKGFPVGLLKANNLSPGAKPRVQTLDTQSGFIYDIAAPVLLEKNFLGQVRIGILQNRIQKMINVINLIFLGITLFIMGLGALLVYKISSLITQPISKLVEATQSIQKGNFSTRIDIRTQDEIGILAGAFNKMAAYLEQLAQEIERLAQYREREKIALDLHDNCAQDLANLIKRLELCAKLFRIDPDRALEELNALKDNIREHLSKARQIIHGLKSPEDGNFILPRKIEEYIDDFRRHNPINVRLNVSGPALDDIPQERARHIFYIISEALVNIRKHAQAGNVELNLDAGSGKELTISIKDDGRGFDPKEAESLACGRGNWGLATMRQRAASLGGALTINSASGRGTEIFIRVPFEGG